MKVGKRKLDFIENELCLVGLSPPKSLDQAADRENRFNTRVKPTFRFRMKLESRVGEGRTFCRYERLSEMLVEFPGRRRGTHRHRRRGDPAAFRKPIPISK